MLGTVPITTVGAAFDFVATTTKGLLDDDANGIAISRYTIAVPCATVCANPSRNPFGVGR